MFAPSIYSIGWVLIPNNSIQKRELLDLKSCLWREASVIEIAKDDGNILKSIQVYIKIKSCI